MIISIEWNIIVVIKSASKYIKKFAFDIKSIYSALRLPSLLLLSL